MMRNTIIAMSIAAFAAAGTASAQENATFTLRSGERQSGPADGPWRRRVSPSGSTARSGRFPPTISPSSTSPAAVRSQADWDRLNSGQFVVLRDGQIITGQLTDVGGTAPLRLSFNVNGSNRDFHSNDVARIVLARPNDVPATSPPSTEGGTGSDGMLVPARQRWTPTGLTVRRGETLTFNATGEIRFGAGADAKATAGGSEERSNENPVPTATTGTLIGRVGNGQPFAIGAQGERADARGRSVVPGGKRHPPRRQRWIVHGSHPARRRRATAEIGQGSRVRDHGSGIRDQGSGKILDCVVEGFA